MRDAPAAPPLRRLAGALVLTLTLAACDAPTTPEVPPAAAGLFDDDPALAGSGDWQWMSTPGMRCRDGSQTGFGLRRAAGSRNLLIMLQGGGACFAPQSCGNNRSSFDGDDFAAYVAESGELGVFDRSRPENPLRDWNVVFVPYCTGDFHAGDAPGTAVPGVDGLQNFVGLHNMDRMLRRIGRQARRARHVVLAGESAGGFGAVLTYDLVARRLAPAPVDLLDDSGPLPPANDVLSPELQAEWAGLWNLATAAPPDCAECAGPDGLPHFLPHHTEAYPDRRFGLLSYREDAAIRYFFGGIGAEPFEDGLFGIRPTLSPNGGTYFIEGTYHLILLNDYFYDTTSEGVLLTDWVAAFLDGAVTDVPAGAATRAPWP